jgi:dihydrofolate synthase/folylpolyglutamate synthase
MNYRDAVRYLLSLGKELAAPRQPAHVQKFDLRNIRLLAERMGNPQHAVPCAHVAGTNGKGSTAAMLASILEHAGLRTGLYTSPHLARLNERIRASGEEISDDDFAAAFTRVHALIEELLAQGEAGHGLAAHPTFFECLTAMAFDFFAGPRPGPEVTQHRGAGNKTGGDFAVYEVGMGGRLDSTNIVEPEVAVITQVDFDHENFLGHSIEEIAAEKAGIIKPGAWVVASAERPEARAVIAGRSAAQRARLMEIDVEFRVARTESIAARTGCYRVTVEERSRARCTTLELGLAGRFQIRNALAALAAARLLGERGFAVTEEAIARGIAEVRWPGRLERVRESPDVYLDGAHNPAGARALLDFWREHLAGRRIHLLYGALRDKAVDEFAGLLFPHAASVVLTQPATSRAISAGHLAQMTRHLAANAQVVPQPAEALAHALQRASADDIVFVTGSLYLVGEVRALLLARAER